MAVEEDGAVEGGFLKLSISADTARELADSYYSMNHNQHSILNEYLRLHENGVFRM